MDPPTTSRSLPAGWTFFRQWLKNPLRVAAISPSSRQLARQMMTQLPRQLQQSILQAAFDSMQPEGRFIQFTYGPANPVTKEVIEALELSSRRASFTWWNVPPATVYVYQRRVSRTIVPRSMR